MTPCEYYARAVVTSGRLEAILGLEFEPGEDLARLRWGMEHVVGQAIEKLHDAEAVVWDVSLAELLVHQVGQCWPGRRWFIEVQYDDPNEGRVTVIARPA